MASAATTVTVAYKDCLRVENLKKKRELEVGIKK
jgi:hypothetical protein